MTADSEQQPSSFTPLTREEALRLWPLAVHARHLLEKLRYVDYKQAEVDAALLAQKIQGQFMAGELGRAAFTAIPRGGSVVLGLLAYQLDLRSDQLMAGAIDRADLVFLVDDCALSGSRLKGALPLFSSHSVVVAHLYSTPGLRAAIREAFPHVQQCLAARDLAEDEGEAPEIGRSHVGPTELIAFAWNEPDLLLKTPFDKRPDHRWRLLPPHKCLNNRQALGLPPAPPVALEWIVPEGLVYGWFDGALYLLDTRSEDVYRLDGRTADCWRAAAGYGNTETAFTFLQNQHPSADQGTLNHFLFENLLQFKTKQLLSSS